MINAKKELTIVENKINAYKENLEEMKSEKENHKSQQLKAVEMVSHQKIAI